MEAIILNQRLKLSSKRLLLASTQALSLRRVCYCLIPLSITTYWT